MITITAPFQTDMKNNAIQHASTIVNNEEGIEATGVIGNKITEDIYTKVAISSIHEIVKDKANPINGEILLQLDPNNPETIKIMRSIAKRPTMVVIYNASKITMINYVFEVLKELNIQLRKEARTLLAKTIINKSLELLSKEVKLMTGLKNILKGQTPYLE